MKEMVRLEGVWKIYDLGKSRVYALRGVDFSLKENEFVAIMGPSGSGKSTLLHLIGLLDKPSRGDVIFKGKNVSALTSDDLAEIRSKEIGFIFQQFNLMPYLNALENVYLPALFSGGDLEKAKERAKKLLSLVGLKGKEKHKPNELSGGEQQRVAIARALTNDPDIILADEPTGNLDSKTGRQIMELLAGLHKKGKTIVVVTHDANIAGYAKRLVSIKDGSIEKGHRSKKYAWKK